MNRAVWTVPEAGQLLGIGRTASYEAARRGQIPTLRIGRRILVPRIALEHMLRHPGAWRPAGESAASDD